VDTTLEGVDARDGSPLTAAAADCHHLCTASDADDNAANPLAGVSSP
jgi:hypothetical protein